jgi:hypothetical protein
MPGTPVSQSELHGGKSERVAQIALAEKFQMQQIFNCFLQNVAVNGGIRVLKIIYTSSKDEK